MAGKLTNAALPALGWNYIGTLTRSTCGFIIGILLARLLGPRPFGQLAAAGIIFSLGQHLADAGFSSALVQAPELSQRQIRFAFTAQVFMGTAMLVVAILAAPYVALAFHDAAIQRVLYGVAPLFLLQSVGQTSTGLLKRNLAFKAVQNAQVCSYLFGYCAIGLPAAYFGAGVWSLVSAQMAQALWYSVQVYAGIRHSIIPCLDKSGMRLLRFGTKITASNITNWGVYNLEDVFAGRAFGSTGLGLYRRAFTILLTPAQGIVGTFQQVLFASYSRAGIDMPRIRRAYLAVTAGIGMIVLPLFWSLAACASSVVIGLYGSRWTEAIPLILPLALAVPLYALMGLAGPVLAATDHIEQDLGAQALSFVVAAAAFAISVLYSLTVMAWAVVFAYAFRYWVSTRPALRLLGIRWGDVARVLAGPAAVGVVTTCVVFVANSVATYCRIQPLYILGGLAFTGAVTVSVLLVLVGDRVLAPELVGTLMHITARLPRRFGLAFEAIATRQSVRLKQQGPRVHSPVVTSAAE